MRLQVLNLPAPADEFPFALVVDQCADPESLGDLGKNKDVLGARGVLVFSGEVEVA